MNINKSVHITTKKEFLYLFRIRIPMVKVYSDATMMIKMLNISRTIIESTEKIKKKC